MSLTDEDTSVVDGLGETSLEDTGLETTVEELLSGKTENVVELLLGLVEDSETGKTTEDGLSLEDTLGVLLGEGHEHTSGRTKLGNGVLNAPDFTLVLEA